MMSLYNDEYYLDCVKDWQDPNPFPVVEKHLDFYVVRDDKLGYGSKSRFIDFLISTSTEVEEWVYGAANKVGWGPISMTHVCNRYGKKAVCFIAERKEPTWHQQKVLDMGGIIHWVPNGMLNVTISKAKKYFLEDPIKRRLLPMGLDHSTVLGSIIKVARSIDVNPTEIWTVASSGTLTRGLQMAFPDVPVYAVQIGHKMNDYEKRRATVMVSPYKYDQRVEDEYLPPFESEKYYDAKVWEFVKTHGKPGALIWNVA